VIKKLFIIPLVTYPLLAISLPKLIEIGVEKNSQLQKSKLDIEYAKEQSKLGKADRLGSIDLVASYTKFNQPRTLSPLTPTIMKDPVTAANVATTEDLFGTGVSYSVPLFTGFAHTRQIEMDSISLQMSTMKSSLVKEQIIYNIRSLYLSILSNQELYNAQKQYILSLEKLKDQIALEVNLGRKARIDLLKSQSNLQSNISYLENIKANIIILKASLASLVGIDSVGDLKSMKVVPKKSNLLSKDILRDSSSLNRIKVSNLNLKKSEKAIEKSKSARLPQVSLDSYYGYNYGYNDSSNQNSGDFADEENWQVSLNAKWTIYDFGKRDATTQKAKIGYMKSKIDSQQTELDLQKLSKEAVANIAQYYATYISNKKQLKLAKESESIETTRYYSDASTLNDLLYAKSQTSLAKAKLIDSKYKYQIGKYYIDYLQERN
jgi:outer membrane protein TolC